MLEGKELEGKIGSVGSYSLDIDDKLMLVGEVQVNVDVYAELLKLAQKSKSKALITVVEFAGRFLGRDEKQVAGDVASEGTPV
jgi:hypothetical protein